MSLAACSQNSERRTQNCAALLLLIFLAGCAPVSEIQDRRVEERRGIQVSVVVAEGRGVSGAVDMKYRGRLERVRRGGRDLLVNHVGLDDYVMGVLPSEVPPLWPDSVLKAMAVVTRTYAWEKWRKRAGEDFHLLADTRDQVYGGVAAEHARSTRAVKATRGLVLVKDGQPVRAFSHSCCAGHTEAIQEVWGGGPVSFLRGVSCRWCIGSRHYGPWVLILDRATLVRRLKPKVRPGGRLKWIRTDGQTRSGRGRTVVVEVGSRTVRLSGAKFRALVGYNDLRSARFEVAVRGESIEFRGTGWGHGVGICQEGACALAKDGRGFRDILNHYFPGTAVVRL